MKFDRLRFVANVREAAKRQHLDMDELEQESGVETGYFARLQRGEEKAAPEVDLLLKISDLLGVPLDVLLKQDLDIASEPECTLYLYLHKLIQETMTHKLVWREDTSAYLDSLFLKTDGTPIHPLFSTEKSEDDSESEPYYISYFRPHSGLIPVDSYACVFPDHRTLYLVRVWNTGDDPLSPGDWTELELQMTGPQRWDTVPLCHSDHTRPSLLNTMLESLFSVVEEALTQPYLSEEARAIINAYLADGTPVSPSSGEAKEPS